MGFKLFFPTIQAVFFVPGLRAARHCETDPKECDLTFETAFLAYII